MATVVMAFSPWVLIHSGVAGVRVWWRRVDRAWPIICVSWWLAAEDFDGFGAPGLALLCKRSGLMFGLAGFQGGLLCQCDRFDVGGFASVVCLELLGQLGGAGFDGLAARGPAGVEFGVDADDFADRALAPTGRRHLGELQSEALAKVCFQARVVQLGDGDHDPVKGLAVQGQPALHSVGIDGGDLVGDRDVGVQVGVACPGVSVGECGADQAGGVDLSHTGCTGSGEGAHGLP